jgi:hypothetical protein
MRVRRSRSTTFSLPILLARSRWIAGYDRCANAIVQTTDKIFHCTNSQDTPHRPRCPFTPSILHNCQTSGLNGEPCGLVQTDAFEAAWTDEGARRPFHPHSYFLAVGGNTPTKRRYIAASA